MTNLEALKAVYVAIGGESSAVAGLSDNAAVIAKIAEVAATVATAATTAELPTVAVGDAGDVLTVSAEGKWVAAALPAQTSGSGD